MKIMYKRGTYGYKYAVPDSFKELKALVHDGWCVTDYEFTYEELIEFFNDCEWLNLICKDDLTEQNWRDLPQIPFAQAIDMLFEHDEIAYENGFIYTKEELDECFENYLYENSQMYIFEALRSYEEEKEYNRWINNMI